MGWFDFKWDSEVGAYTKKVYYNLTWLACIYPKTEGWYLYLTLLQFTFYTLICVPFAMLCIYTAFMCAEDFIFASEYLLNASFALFTQSIFTCLCLHMKENTAVHTILIKEFPKYKNIEKTELDKIKKDTKGEEIHLKLLVFFMSLSVPNLLIVEPFLENLFNSKSIKIPNGDEKLIMPVWSPNPDNAVVHAMILILQIFQPCVTAVISLTGIFLFMNLTHSLMEQIKILNSSVSNLEQRAKRHFEMFSKKDRANSNWTYMDSVDMCLNENIKHLNVLKRYKEEMQNTVSLGLFCVITLATFFIAFTGYVIIESEGHPGKLSFAINVFIIEVYSLGYFNTFGQYVIDESEKLRHTVYGISWYTFDKKCCKKLNILQTMCLDPMVISVGRGMVPLNMASFQKILKSSYSVVNMLMAIKNE